MMKQVPPWSIGLLLLAVLLAAGCGSQPLPAPTPIATYTVSPDQLDRATSASSSNLLTSTGEQAQCDGSPEAVLTCRQENGVTRIETETNAGIFARWSLPLDPAANQLNGNETLRLRARAEGDLTPRLYLVDGAGTRVAVILDHYGLGEAWHELHIPFREVRTVEGVAPQLDDLRYLEIVFEWADMSGALEIDDLRFVPTWREDVTVGDGATTLAAGLTVPDGFVVEALADRLLENTQIDFTPDGDMLVSLQNGRIWWYEDSDDDGLYDRRRLYDHGYAEIVGLLYDPVDGAVWLGGRGQLYRTLDSDGDGAADVREVRIDGLPWGRHQNNGLAWNPGVDPFTGEAAYAWIYFGLGSTGDLEVGGELSATVLRFPREGESSVDLEVVSRGNRNAYMVAFGAVPVDLTAPDGDTAWQLFASENGPDFNDAPDEVNHIRWGHHYGFPDQFGPVAAGETDGEPYSGPVYPATPHASASGLAYIDNPAWPPAYRTFYTTLFGEVFDEEIVGHMVERMVLTEEITADGKTYRATPSDFVSGLDRPLGMKPGPDGNLVFGDYASGVIYRVRYVGEE